MAPHRTIDTIHPFGPYRKEYDANYISSQVIEELSAVRIIGELENSVIGQFAGKTYIMGIGFSGDYINSYVFDKTNDYFYNGSIKYDKETPKGIGLRGWMHPSGFAAFKTE
uniref:Uncharacterized protein n=1 Tax=Romanomermis culicivorax TaxID=13658 RepID=A0A915KP85_ROMCU